MTYTRVYGIIKPWKSPTKTKEETKMLNQEMRTVTMNRSDMLRVAQALTHVVLEFRDEVRTATTEDRRRSAKCSLDMWERICSEFDRQMDEQDPEEFRRK